MRLFIAYQSYTENMKNEFSNEIDIHQVLGEQNTFRYLAIKNIVFRILPEDSLIDCFLIILAANTANSKLTISIEQSDIKLVAIKKVLDSDSKILIQGDIDFLKEIPKHNRIRVCSKNIPVSYFTEAAKTGKYIATEKPITEGRLELLHYLKEQSIAFEYHRYGSINI